MYRTDKYSQHSSIIWPVWLNGWVFVYQLSGCGFASSCSHLKLRFRACLEQGVPWHSGNYRVWIHSETRTWHDKNQSNAPYRLVLTKQFNHLASRAKWLSVRLWTRWLWVRVQLQSIKQKGYIINNRANISKNFNEFFNSLVKILKVKLLPSIRKLSFKIRNLHWLKNDIF